MLLRRPLLDKYIDEINDMHAFYLPDSPPLKSVTYFGKINRNSELMAVATIKCYGPCWCLRSCIVKPKYRGRGLQRQLIRERLEYLLEEKRTKLPVIMSAHLGNQYSIDNILAEGFVFERQKKLKNSLGQIRAVLNVYRLPR